MMKNRRIKLTIATLTSCIALNTIAFASSFTDVKDHWGKDHINNLTSKNIITGYPDKTFKPNSNISREEVSKILSSYIGEKEVENDKLSDIEGRWSTKFIKHLVNEEIITGYPDGTFKPSNNVTRAEFATITYKYLAKENKLTEGQINKLTDIEGHWAKQSIEGVAKAGVVKGYPDGTFKPNNSITRAEVSTVVSLIDGFKPVEPEKPVEVPSGEVSLDEAITNQKEYPWLKDELLENVKVSYEKLPIQLSDNQPKIIEFSFMDDKKDALAFVADGDMRTPQVIFLKGNKMVGGIGIFSSKPMPGDKSKWVYRIVDDKVTELWEKSDSIGLYHLDTNKLVIITKTEIKSGYNKYGWVY